MFKTILLTVDVNDLKGSERPAEAALRMAKTEGAALHVINVVPDLACPSSEATLTNLTINTSSQMPKRHLSLGRMRCSRIRPVTLHVDQARSMIVS